MNPIELCIAFLLTRCPLFPGDRKETGGGIEFGNIISFLEYGLIALVTVLFF